MIGFILVAGALALGEAKPILPGAPVAVAVDGSTPTQTLTWTSDCSGHVVVAATSDRVDPAIRAIASTGEAQDDDDGGGETAACLVLPTEPGVTWTFEVRGASASDLGTASVRLRGPRPAAPRV